MQILIPLFANVWYDNFKKEIKPMAKTKSEIKNSYAKRHYDDIRLQVPKGQKEIIKEYASRNGYTIGGLIKKIINDELSKEI